MMVELRNCTKAFKKRRAVDGFSMQFGNGVYGLLGPNGAGKTTLMRCICGLYKLDSGNIEGAGGPIGYLPQQFGMFRELTLAQMMEYFATLKGIDKREQKEQIQFCIEQVNLSDRLHSRIASLSGGMIRRAGIAQAILGSPETILFDEPTAGLDPEERTRFKNVVAGMRGNKTVIISTHIVSDVEAACDLVVIMDNGRLLTAGTTAEIAGIANEKVWLVSAEREAELKGEFFLKDRTEENGKKLLRVLSDDEQPGEQVAPTMEDGYLCAIKRL